MDFNDRISSIEKKIPFILTKGKLEDGIFNFKNDQKIKDSDLITFSSLPSSSRVDEEDRNADFSIFGHNWDNVEQINITCISTSQDGKYCIAACNLGGLYLSLDFGNSWILNDHVVVLASNTIYNSVSISLDGSILIATSGDRSVISKDFGNTWKILDILSSNTHSTSISCDNRIIVISNLLGVGNVNKWGVYSINRGDDDEEDNDDQNNLYYHILPDDKIQSILDKFTRRVVIG